jgi:1-acyl-sn-glycerol-3-phosphate acyltransferase
MDSRMESEKLFDIKKIFSSKLPKLYKKLPNIALIYLQRIFHEKEINQFLFDHRNLKDYDFISAIVDYLNLKLDFQGLENIPKTGGVYIVSNHASVLDGIVLLKALSLVRPDVCILANDFFSFFNNNISFFVPVNKMGIKQDCESIKKVFRSEKAVIIFPAGNVARKTEGEIKDAIWKKSFIINAKNHQRDIIPVYIESKCSSFFYNLCNLRKLLRINFKLEMFYLIDEAFKQKNTEIITVFGKPISSTFLDESKTPIEWSEIIRKKAHELKCNTTLN